MRADSNCPQPRRIFSEHPGTDKGVGLRPERTESEPAFVLQLEYPVTLKGIEERASPECDSGLPSYFNSSGLLHLRASVEVQSNFGSIQLRTQSDTRLNDGRQRRDDPEGHPDRGVAPRVLRISSKEVVTLKPVEVKRPRHAISCRLRLVRATHEFGYHIAACFSRTRAQTNIYLPRNMFIILSVSGRS